MTTVSKLAIVCSHPIQYFSPWFRWLSGESGVQLKVFFLDKPEDRQSVDPDFGQSVQWDVPLLEGFDSTFVKNTAADPGTHHYRGLNNPTLWSEIRAYAPDITLLMTYRYQSILPAMLRRKLPPNTWLRGDSVLLSRRSGLRQWIADRVIRRAFASLTGALYVGQHNHRYFTHHGLPADRLMHSPPAIDLAEVGQTQPVHELALNWRKSLGIPQHHQVVLFVGKLQSIKRPMLLLRAFRQASVENTSLVFVGAGEQAQALSREAGQDPNIHLLGFQNQLALPAIYAGADLLVLPSTSETWGLVVNEAFSMGTGALVSDAVGCAPDLIARRDTGLVFPSDNAEALVNALRSSLTSPSQLKQWGQKARALVVAEFSFSAMSRGLSQAINQSVGDAVMLSPEQQTKVKTS